jgi:hypothetical protein
MPVFTCAEMVEACLAGQDTGWQHFITDCLPFAGLLLDRHYPELAPQRDNLLREVLLRSRDQDAQFFRDYHGHSEREFLLHLREHVLGILQEAGPAGRPPAILLPWETFESAFRELTALERQVVWLYLLSPAAEDTALMLRADRASIDAILNRAQERLRRAADHWSADLLEQNRHLLAAHVRTLPVQDCPDAKAFIRLLDGQNPWCDRHELEHHLVACWRCVDRLCRFREVSRLSKLVTPWTPAEAEPYAAAAGLTFAPRPRWKRLLRRN